MSLELQMVIAAVLVMFILVLYNLLRDQRAELDRARLDKIDKSSFYRSLNHQNEQFYALLDHLGVYLDKVGAVEEHWVVKNKPKLKKEKK